MNFFNSQIVKQTELQIFVANFDALCLWRFTKFKRTSFCKLCYCTATVTVSFLCLLWIMIVLSWYNNFSLCFVLFFISVIVLDFKLMKANCFIVKSFPCNLCDLLNFLCFLSLFFVFRVISSYRCSKESYRCCNKLNKRFECFPII